MNSYFIAGTDTDVGKTVITAGLARVISNSGVDVGIMKPFAAGEQQKSGFQSEDAEILAKAANVNDPEDLINPQFFPIPASPFTASMNLGITPDLKLVLDSFAQLKQKHEMLLVEGMGGIMTPILSDYYVIDLIQQMQLPTIIITRTKIGTVNHTLMTLKVCQDYNLKVLGIIINSFDSEGYPADELKRDFENLTDVPVLGIIPKITDLNVKHVANIISDQISIDELLTL